MVYILECKGLYKIGYTLGDINKRIKQLQTGNPFNLFTAKLFKVEHPYNFEKILHAMFAKYNRGGERFKLEAKHFKTIEKLLTIYKANE